MADIYGMLDELQHRAAKEEDIKEKLLATRKEEEPFSAFCRVCRELGYEIYEMELICAGEEFHAEMKAEHQWRWGKFTETGRRR